MTTEQETPELTYPCDFSIKVMGEDIDNYADTVLEITQRHVEDVNEDSVQIRPSRNGKYIAVTIQLVAHSREQLDRLYLELNAHEHTRMAL